MHFVNVHRFDLHSAHKVLAQILYLKKNNGDNVKGRSSFYKRGEKIKVVHERVFNTPSMGNQSQKYGGVSDQMLLSSHKFKRWKRVSFVCRSDRLIAL